MEMQRTVHRAGAAFVAVLVMMGSFGASAALVLESDERFVWDDVLEITWLRDANYAQTSGFDSDGRMKWGAANAWAQSLSFTVNGTVIDGWRLPTATELTPDDPSDVKFAYDGSGDYGYNITRPSSELSHLYYVSLGNKGLEDGSGILQSGAGFLNTGPFQNVQVDSTFWTSTASSIAPLYTAYWFGNYGRQQVNTQSGESVAWAVRPGRVVASVPEPATWMLLAAGLGLVGARTRAYRRIHALGTSAM
jgi:hypothetical protein